MNNTEREAREGVNPCKCIDCGGTEQGHSDDCTYMRELHGQPQQEAPSEQREGDPRKARNKLLYGDNT